MNLLEALIVYLSIGASFGVYYFLQERNLKFGFKLWSATLAVAFFWFFFAFYLIFPLAGKYTSRLFSSDWKRENSIEAAAQKLFSSYSLIPQSPEKIPFFQFREIVERYVGLTLAAQNAEETNSIENRSELFVVAGRKQELKLANRCLRRKNLSRLETHQARARRDFLQICAESLASVSQYDNKFEDFLKTAVKFTEQINDAGATGFLTNKKERKNAAQIASSEQEKAAPHNLQTQQSFILQPQSFASKLTQARD